MPSRRRPGPAFPGMPSISSLASSYVATTTAAVTKTGSTEGCVIVEAMLPQGAGGTNVYLAQITDSTGQYRIYTLMPAGAGTAPFANVRNAGWFIGNVASPTAVAFGTPFRCATRWGPSPSGFGTQLSICTSGGAVASAQLLVPPGLGELQIAHGFGGGQFNGRMRRVWCSATAPTDSQLIAATVANADVDAILRG